MYECWCMYRAKQHQHQSVFSSSFRTSHLKAVIGSVLYWAFLNDWLVVRLFFRYCRILYIILYPTRCWFSFSLWKMAYSRKRNVSLPLQHLQESQQLCQNLTFPWDLKAVQLPSTHLLSPVWYAQENYQC